MWVSKSKDWNPSHTELSRYFIERIKQKVDPTEVISNKHKTTNGITLISEIIDVINIAKNRKKSLNRLISLIEEAKSKVIDSSVVNDYIIQKYHPDIIAFVEKITTSTIKENDLSYLEHSFRLFFERLLKDYFENIREEFNLVDFKKGNFERSVKVIDKLIDSLIPYLLFQDFSPQSISEIAFWYIQKNDGDTSASKLLNMFSIVGNACKFLMLIPKNAEEFEFIKKLINKDGGKVEEVPFERIKNDFYDAVPNVPQGVLLFEITISAKDPHNYLRTLYEGALKSFVMAKDQLSLKFFNDFLDTTYWRFARVISNKKHGYRSTRITLDPINVKLRPSTLKNTLIKCHREYDYEFREGDYYPYLEGIDESIYYYNMALRSKSIENSLSLLWTSLESLLPYRFNDTDIENVQHFVSTSLSFGVIGRQLTSFINRLIGSLYANDVDFSTWNLPYSHSNLSPSIISDWAKWLCTEFNGKGNDPYNYLKPMSEIVCSKFCKLNLIYSGASSDLKALKYFNTKIAKSEVAIKFQLDRIYLHRNQIVHSGKFTNEYSNLWSHLEWYVGKLIAFYCIRSMQQGNWTLKKEDVFMELEHDYSYIKNLFRVHEKENFIKLDSHFPLFFKHSWQFF
jgi:hypothetical protein